MSFQRQTERMCLVRAKLRDALLLADRVIAVLQEEQCLHDSTERRRAQCQRAQRIGQAKLKGGAR